MSRSFSNVRRLRRLVAVTGACTLSALVLVSDIQAQTVDPSMFDGLSYRNVGPSRGGRVTTVAGHRSHPSTFYMGATGGGVWKTTNYGATWRNISDGYFATGSIGAIRVAPSEPTTVYVGTGSDGIRSNVITGKGVYKSTDSGQSWTHIGLVDVGQIGAVEVDPRDPNTAYVAAIGDAFGPSERRGVYRTRDGGANWERVLFVADSVGAVDLELVPDDPSTVIAAMWRAERKPWSIISGADGVGGIYKSTDRGDSWEKKVMGLPTGLMGKIDLAVTRANSNIVYALVEAIDEEEGLYRSSDRGETWELVSTEPGIMNRPFYYTNVDADPTDASTVYVNNERFYKSTDGGKSWNRLSTPHGDNHDMWINPDNPELFIQSNDGGANVTLDGGHTWSSQLNQPTAELYQIDVDDRYPYRLYAGQQDNTTIMVPSLPPEDGSPAGWEGAWKAIGGCETGPAVPQPGNPDVVFSNCKGRFGRYSHITGMEQQYYVGAVDMYGANPKDLPYRFQRVVPIEVSPHDPSRVYHGSQYVHATDDGGQTWERISPDLTAFRPERQVYSGRPITRDITGEEHYSVLYAIEESPIEPGVIYTGANDGPVHVTRNGGQSWTEVTPPDMPPEGRIQTIDVSPHSPGKAYFAGYRYLLGDWEPYAYRTDDYGTTWTRLTTGANGVPADFPTRAIREDPDREGLLYLGTEFGMFVSFDDGMSWQPFQQNLPVTPITDIKVVQGDLALSTMGRSFWIMDDVTRLHQLGDFMAAGGDHLFEPRSLHRTRFSTGGLGDGPSPAAPQYPMMPAGRYGGGYTLPAVIDYHLASDRTGEVTLEILDGQGGVVRSFSSEGEGQEATAGQGMRAPWQGVRGEPRVASTAGTHRFYWNLRHPGPRDEDGERRAGPMALPGAYDVRLSAGGQSHTVDLIVTIDPRVATDGVTQADLEEQLALALRTRDMLSEAYDAQASIERALGRLEGASGGNAAEAREELTRLRTAMVTEGASYPPRMLTRQIEYLYSMLTTADQKPGRDAHERYDQLREEMNTIQRDLDRVQSTVAELEGAGTG
jgi:photosystem II stability/assembly factor-like uncharacterized protein